MCRRFKSGPRYEIRLLAAGFPVLRLKGTPVAATDVRPKITLACQVCKHRNYITNKNRRNDPDRLSMNKFCPNCGKHTEHRETR